MKYSILFPNYERYEDTKSKNVMDQPYFKDLRLDLVFSSIINAKKAFALDKYYYEPLEDIDTIYYRQEVMEELENLELRNIVTEFSNEVYSIRRSMKTVRKGLSENEGHNNYLTRGRMLNHAEKYCTAISRLKEEISKVKVGSDGLLGFVSYIKEYVATESYQNLSLVVKKLRKEFSNIEYSMLITGGRTIKVREYEGQRDYSKKLAGTFEKFRQGDVRDYRHDLSEDPGAGHVEAGVLDLLSKIHKDTFNELSNFCSEFIDFDDETIIRFSQEVQFYISWLDYIQPLKDDGLKFNYPKMKDNSDHLYACDCFDIALAVKTKNETVTNDFDIKLPESIIVVTGPNQGGKTTFAKMFGQIHYLASIGLCVPGRKSSLYVFDNIFTHFSREEDILNQSGKLKDDLERFYEITSKATSKSLIIINEIFTSTTLDDAVYLGNRMMDHLVDLKAPTVIITFLDELALDSEAAVSMMSTLKDDDSMERTYKIVRKPPDGSAYAIHIASKHGLTYDKLSRRLNQ